MADKTLPLDAYGNKLKLKDNGDGTYSLAAAVPDGVKIYGSKTGKKITATVTRPNNADAYSIGDVVGNTTYLTFANVGEAGQMFQLLSIRGTFKKAATNLAVPTGMATFKMQIYNAPPTVIADNAPWTLGYADADKYIDEFALNQPVDKGDVLKLRGNYFNDPIVLVDGNLYGYLVTDAIFTPTPEVLKSIDLLGLLV